MTGIRAPISSKPSSRAVAQGLRRGGAAVFRSFFRALHALWLEVTGFFFLVFAVAFGAGTFRSFRAASKSGAGYGEAVGAACLALLFLYFGLTAFWRARRGNPD